MKEHNNKGFSLIELVITIAIMAVVVGASVSIYSWIKSHRMQSFAENTNDVIGSLRSDTLSKDGAYELVIKKSGDNFVAEVSNGTKSETTTLGSAKYSSSLYGTVSSTKYTVEDGHEIHISFNRVDGSFNKMDICTSSGSSIGSVSDGYIYLSTSGLSKKIKLVKLTGKHYIEKDW